MKDFADQKKKLLRLNRACLRAWNKLPEEKALEIFDYDVFHADFLASRGVIVQPTARWTLKDDKGNGTCSNCNRQDAIDPLATHCRFCGAKIAQEG